jgi:hypothetical protein
MRHLYLLWPLILALAGCNTYNPYLGATPTQSSTITLITPSGCIAGRAVFTMTVQGSGFVPGTSVTWSNLNNPCDTCEVKLATVFVSSPSLEATVTPDQVANPGAFAVGTIAPGPSQGNGAGNGISNFRAFTVCPVAGCSLAFPEIQFTPVPFPEVQFTN